MLNTLTRWRTGTAELAYTDSGGDGDALVLIHGGGLADWFTPLATGPLPSHHRVIRVVRAGYTDTTAPAGLTIADHSRHTAALLRELDAGPAHVVAHSSGSTIGLQLAVDRPDVVRTLSLCEPPLVEALAAPDDHDQLRAMFGPVIGSVMAATARGDLADAFDTFMALVCGPDHRRVMTDVLGAGLVEESVNRSRYFFTDEVAAVDAWTVDPADLARLHMPVLLIQGSASPPPLHRLVAHLATLIPGSTVATITGANHLMPLTEPAALSRVIDDFCRSSVRSSPR